MHFVDGISEITFRRISEAVLGRGLDRGVGTADLTTLTSLSFDPVTPVSLRCRLYSAKPSVGDVHSRFLLLPLTSSLNWLGSLNCMVAKLVGLFELHGCNKEEPDSGRGEIALKW